MDKVRNLNNSEYYTPSTEPFRIIIQPVYRVALLRLTPFGEITSSVILKYLQLDNTGAK
jgi:hypothetical protein